MMSDMKYNSCTKRKKGFTMIEVMICVTVLATLILMGIPKFNNYMIVIKNLEIKQDIEIIRLAVYNSKAFTESELNSQLDENYKIESGYLKKVNPYGNKYKVDFQSDNIVIETFSKNTDTLNKVTVIIKIPELKTYYTGEIYDNL